MPRKATTAVSRLTGLVSPEPNTGCWLWTGSADNKGYGRLKGAANKYVKAHRLSYERHVGPIAPGLVLDHLCRVKSCVNPAHLEPVSSGENTRRGTLFASPTLNKHKTHCVRGHAFSSRNTYRNTQGRRKCRKCVAIRNAAKREASQANKGRGR